VITTALALYIAGLFAIAWLGDSGRLKLGRWSASGEKSSLIIYSLSLAVYCTSWTFYGAVGTAASSGWEYLPIYLGPILVFTALRPVVRKMLQAGKKQHSTSISDFISSRYGRSRSLAALITIIATIGAIPYFALQLRSVAFTLDTLMESFSFGFAAELFMVAGFLALFAIIFGTRHLDITEHNRGMIAAIALDSVVKLLALALVGGLAFFMLTGTVGTPVEIIKNPFAQPLSIDRFTTLTLLSMAAILCLPRQFHVTVVECQQPQNMAPAATGFVIYLLLVSAFVIPITMAGMNLQATSGGNPDLYVLALPASVDMNALTLFTFIGGFAAATGMIVVGGVALSTMITNDLFVPVYLQMRGREASSEDNLARPILFMRRATIIVLMLAAAAFAAMVPSSLNLASLGIVSFAAVAQFMPGLIGGLYWRRGTKVGVHTGLIAGFGFWLFCLLIPSLFSTPSIADAILPFGWDSLTNGTVLSLGSNILLFIVTSLMTAPTLSEKVQASPFLNPDGPSPVSDDTLVWQENLSAGDLRLIMDKCLGAGQGQKSFDAYQVLTNKTFRDADPVDTDLIRFAERQLSRTLGASSARILMTGALAGKGLKTEDVVTLLDETSQILQFNQEILQTTLENIPQGVSVIDRNLKIVAWNSAYLEMYQYPDGFIYAGKPVEEILRFNAARGAFGNGDVETQIKRRLAHLKNGTPHTHERQRPNGTFIKLQGQPIPGGGYVTTFTDVTEYKRIENALRHSEHSIRFYTDNIPFPIAYTDRHEKILFSNAAYREIFGNRVAHLGGKKLKDILPDAAYTKRRPYIQQALNGERVSFDIEMRHKYEDILYMQVSYVPQLDETGAVAGFFGLYQDITQRVKAEQALRETNETLEDRVRSRTRELEELNTALESARQDAISATQSKTRFLAAASHDVLQPLNAARLFNSALISDLKDSGSTEELAQKVEKSIASADLLLKTLLNISKLDAGGVSPVPTVFSLGELFREIADEFSVMAEEKDLRLSYVHTDIHVDTDRGLLRSVLQNLIINAIRYTQKGGVLIGCRRSLQETGKTLAIQVCDTGVGIPYAKQQEIFNEFARLDQNADIEGLGLGLAIVERICKLLDHSISLSSVPGQGSIFSITMMAAEATATEIPAKPVRQSAAQSFAGMRVLCVDNEPGVLAAMEALLHRWGITPLLARDKADVTSILEQQESSPDIILLDYQLDNGETGFDIYDYLRAELSIVPHTALVTAEDSEDVRKKARALNIPVLQKPLEPAILRSFLAGKQKVAAE
jgi:PAS domain S-box-containing protein